MFHAVQQTKIPERFPFLQTSTRPATSSSESTHNELLSHLHTSDPSKYSNAEKRSTKSSFETSPSRFPSTDSNRPTCYPTTNLNLHLPDFPGTDGPFASVLFLRGSIVLGWTTNTAINASTNCCYFLIILFPHIVLLSLLFQSMQ